MHYLLLIKTPFFLLVDTFPRFPQKSFEKRPMVSGYLRFSQELHANPRKVSTNRKRGIALNAYKKTLKFIRFRCSGAKRLI